jgi:hypothetical protein
VPVLKEENPNIVQNFIEEIPAFLSFLNQRQLKTEKLNRMWFYPSLLKTEAMKKVVEFSRSTVEKEIRQRIRDMFTDFGVREILMTRKAIHREFFNNRYEANYVEKVLRTEMRIDTYWEPDPVKKDLYDNPEKVYKVKRHSYPKWDTKYTDGNQETVRVEVQDHGRPYVFKIEDYLTPEEIAGLHFDDETKFTNTMVSGQETAGKPEPQQDLPF